MPGSRSTHRRAPAAGVLTLAACLALAADAGGGWSDGAVEVQRIHGPGLYEIARDERSAPLRLAGLEPVGRSDRVLHRRCRQEVAGWLDPGLPRLLAGRLNARDEVEGVLRLYDGSTLNERLLASGCALLATTLPEAFDAALRAAQQNARQRRAGLWSDPGLRVEDLRVAREQIATVCGNAGTVRRDGTGGWLLHLGEPYPRHKLTVRIAKEHAHVFESPDETYLRHDLCVTGVVRPHRDAAEMVAVDPSQILDRGGHRAR